MQSPQLGMDYWCECMRHANDQICIAPSRSHDNQCPQDLWDNFIDGAVSTSRKNMEKRWGTACYVLERTHSNFEPKGTTGYLLNYSDAHESRCYDVLCAVTNRVRKTVDVKFPDHPYLDDVKAPDTCTFTLDALPRVVTPTVAPIAPAGIIASWFDGSQSTTNGYPPTR